MVNLHGGCDAPLALALIPVVAVWSGIEQVLKILGCSGVVGDKGVAWDKRWRCLKVS